MKKSESIANLAASLAKFNGEVARISKDSDNPFHKSKYASLDQIIDEVRPVLTKFGLSIMQMPSGDGDNVTITTMLTHESGEWIESEPFTMKPIRKEKGGGPQFSNDPQTVGGILTYARRYALTAFLSLNTGEDDDGNAGSGHTQQGNNHQSSNTQQPTALVSEKQAKMIHAKAKELADLAGDTKENVLNVLAQNIGSFQSVETLDKQRGSKAIETLDSWIKQRKGQ